MCADGAAASRAYFLRASYRKCKDFDVSPNLGLIPAEVGGSKEDPTTRPVRQHRCKSRRFAAVFRWNSQRKEETAGRLDGGCGFALAGPQNARQVFAANLRYPMIALINTAASSFYIIQSI